MTHDCSKCGACCSGGQFIPILPGDDVPAIMTEASGTKMQESMGRCIAMDGRIGVDVSCRIYDRRPVVCKTLAIGSWACEEMRELANVFRLGGHDEN